MDKSIYKILMVGPQGSGKGTQAQILSEKSGIPIFSTGNILRQRIQTKDEMGKKLAKMMNQGILVPDEVVNQIVFEKIDKEGKSGYILDGYPRNLDQAEFLDKKEQLTHVFEIYISDKESLRRFLGRRTCEKCQTVYHTEYNPPKEEGVCDKCGGKLVIREDETEEALAKRLDSYHKLTEPMIEFYKDRQVHHKINGEQSIPDVTEEILSQLSINS